MIKQLNVEDNLIAEDVIDLQKASYIVEAQLMNFYEIPPLKDTIDSIKKSDETFYGFYIENNLCGLISYKLEEKILDIYRVAVHPKYFRKGIARKLIQHIEDINPKVEKVIVSTGAKNEPAIRLYLSLGFQTIKTVEALKAVYIQCFEKYK